MTVKQRIQKQFGSYTIASRQKLWIRATFATCTTIIFLTWALHNAWFMFFIWTVCCINNDHDGAFWVMVIVMSWLCYLVFKNAWKIAQAAQKIKALYDK